MDRKISYRCIWRPTRRGTFGWNGFPTRYMPNSNTTPSALFCCLYRLFTMGIDSNLEERWDNSKGFVAQAVDRLLPWKRTCWFAKRLTPVLICSQRITPVTIMPYGLNLEARSAENHRLWPFSSILIHILEVFTPILHLILESTATFVQKFITCQVDNLEGRRITG